MRKIILYFIALVKGNTFKVDGRVPTSYLFLLSSIMLIELIKGLIYFRKTVFVGKKCTFLSKGMISIRGKGKFSESVYIDATSIEGVVFGNSFSVGPHTRIECTGSLTKLGMGIKIGNNFGVGAFSFFGCAGGIQIGNDVIIGQKVSFHSENHRFNDKDVLIREQGVTNKGIKIGNNVWVGANVTFLDGTDIGERTVVAAGSVVSGKYPPNVIIGGVPARVLKEI